MEEKECCDICGVGDYCGYLLIPCTHRLCEGCKGDVKVEKCQRCGTGVVEVVHEDEITEPGEWKDGGQMINNMKRKHESLKLSEEEIMKRIREIDEIFEKQVSELKRDRDERIQKASKRLEMSRVKIDILESRLELFEEIEKSGKIPRKTILNDGFVSLRTPICDLFEPRFVIGKPESESDACGEFRCPSDLASNSKGQVLVCDSYNHLIKIFGQDGTFIKSFGGEGNGPGKFNYPRGIATDDQDNIYISDSGNNRVQIFNDDGTKVMKIIGKDKCEEGERKAEFDRPRGIFINPLNQDILVADTDNDRIQIFDRNYKFVREFGSHGKDGLNWPTGIAMNSRNEILVSDCDNDRIQVFDYHGNSLRFIGFKNHTIKRPYQLCVDELDNIYVGSFECGIPVQILDRDGNLIKSLKIKTKGSPSGVNINSVSGSLMVTDWENHVVYIY